MPPQGAAYNVAWVLSNTSNVHVANDRAWFTSYTPFRSKLSSMPGAEPSVEVHGVSTVVLPTRIHHQGKSHKPSREVILHNVLHAPGHFINIFATSMEPDLDISLSCDVKPIFKSGTNKVLGLVVFKKLWRLWLKGQTQNQSSLDPKNGMYYIHATWPEEEIKNYNRFLAVSKTEHASKSDHEPPLTTIEKKFRNKRFGSQFGFLLSHGLSAHRKGDLKEGRYILRALMSDPDTSKRVDGHPFVKNNSFSSQFERGPTSHVADYKFSADQLDFIASHYGHSGHFTQSRGLNPYDDDDYDEAVTIVKAFMRLPEDEN